MKIKDLIIHLEHIAQTQPEAEIFIEYDSKHGICVIPFETKMIGRARKLEPSTEDPDGYPSDEYCVDADGNMYAYPSKEATYVFAITIDPLPHSKHSGE